jgi:hypothetical protein
MKVYRVSARIVCKKCMIRPCLGCEICNLENYFEFCDEFKANNIEIAIKLANAKFTMIQDDIFEEFQEYDYELEIINCG